MAPLSHSYALCSVNDILDLEDSKNVSHEACVK